jgi:8-oxo-dGTP pyrophosphatase MutT (NUDIX family)
MKTATLAIILKDGQTLLSERKKGDIGTGVLAGPGGKLEEGESILECLIRETKEEWGITLDPEGMSQTARVTFHAGGIPDFEVHIYTAGAFDGELTETTASKKPEWYPVDALPLARMFDGDRHWFARAVAGEPFVANVYYRERAKDFERIEFLPADF